MKTKLFLSTSLLLVTILAFVYFAQPICAKANSSDMDYVSTDLSTQQVVELFSGAEAFLPAAVLILGFIVLCYCTLRNVQVPISYSSTSSFTDKCTQLGQYVIDNATDSIKNVLYSCYVYAQEHDLTSITGIAKFAAMNLSTFFVAISKWIGSSLVTNISPVGQGLLNQFVPTYSWSSLSPYSYVGALTSVFNQNSSISFDNTFGSFMKYQGSRNVNYNGFSFPRSYNGYLAILVSGSNGLTVYFYSPFTNGVSSRAQIDYYRCSYIINSSNSSSVNVAPSSGLGAVTWTLVSVNNNSYSFPFLYSFDGSITSYNVMNYLVAMGFIVGSSAVAPPQTLAQEDDEDVAWLNDVVNPSQTWSDQIYTPTDDVLPVDIDGVGAALSGGLVASLSDLIALLTDRKSLALGSALTDVQSVQGNGDYVFPSFDGIWKYPQYFFDTLKGWGSFVGGCLNAVTVGDGGLSWIFYGGFVLLICGGIIGKILLG